MLSFLALHGGFSQIGDILRQYLKIIKKIAKRAFIIPKNML